MGKNKIVPRIIPKPGMVGSLFSTHHAPTGWTAPAELPDFSAYPMNSRFGYDVEGTTKNPHTSIQVGMSICTPDKKKYYLPTGHRGGGNLDENAVKRWAKNNLAGRHLCILNAKYDVPVSIRWGLDLEVLGCKPHDPAFKAALLDENRKRYNLNELSSDILGRTKSEVPGDKGDIADMSASEAGGYAEDDAELHLDLDLALQPQIDSEDLVRVCDLEDQLIYSTVAMERRGALLDREKLQRWKNEIALAHQAAIFKLFDLVGFRVNPNSGKDIARVLKSVNIPMPVREEELGGGETYGEEYLARIDHPVVKLMMAARKLDSLNSKYISKYLKLIDYNDILRYSLHQLRTDSQEGRYGTVTGRYASANVNIQQVMKVESQFEEVDIALWIVRECFIPAKGALFVSADASQIEFRWFAHYSKSKKLIAAYIADPTMDFHQLVANMLGQKRKDAKHNNFGKLYTMGIPKLARKLGLSCDCGLYSDDQWDRRKHTPTCRMQKAFAISAEYDAKFPEAKALTKEAMNVAKIRGYVKTILGRRRRYPSGERLHSALNAVIQGTAADTLKVKLLETYNHRALLELDLRFTVHDELDGDLWNPDKKGMFKELLEAPDSRIPCNVPLLWDVETGRNWRETTE